MVSYLLTYIPPITARKCLMLCMQWVCRVETTSKMTATDRQANVHYKMAKQLQQTKEEKLSVKPESQSLNVS